MKKVLVSSVGAIFCVFGLSLPLHAVTADDVNCVGCVGSTDLAGNSVTGAKIKNGSVDGVDLTPALLGRLSALEAEVSALKGGAYSQATLKGTYQCMELSVGTAWNASKNNMSVVYSTTHNSFTADGVGTVGFTATGDEVSQWVYHSGSTNTLVTATKRSPWNESGSVSYTVGSDGHVNFDTGSPGETFSGWVSPSGDSATFHSVDNDTTDRDYFRGLISCVRTAR